MISYMDGSEYKELDIFCECAKLPDGILFVNNMDDLIHINCGKHILPFFKADIQVGDERGLMIL